MQSSPPGFLHVFRIGNTNLNLHLPRLHPGWGPNPYIHSIVFILGSFFLNSEPGGGETAKFLQNKTHRLFTLAFFFSTICRKCVSKKTVLGSQRSNIALLKELNQAIIMSRFIIRS